MLELYSYYRSSCSYRVRIALHLKGVDFKYHSVHLVRDGGEQHKQDYKDLNPQKLVPTLVDGDTTITQSLAIMAYLDEKHPKQALLPTDIKERAFVRQITHMVASDIQPLANLRALHYIAGEFSISQTQKSDWQKNWVTQGFDAIEHLLKNNVLHTGDFCCGDKITLADICLIPQIYNARRLELSIDTWPLIAKIEKHCLSLDAFKAASPEAQEDTPEDQRLAFLSTGQG